MCLAPSTRPDRETERKSDWLMSGPGSGKDGVLYILSIQWIWNIWDWSHNWWFSIFLLVKLLLRGAVLFTVMSLLKEEKRNQQHCHLVATHCLDKWIHGASEEKSLPYIVNTVLEGVFFNDTLPIMMLWFLFRFCDQIPNLIFNLWDIVYFFLFLSQWGTVLVNWERKGKKDIVVGFVS